MLKYIHKRNRHFYLTKILHPIFMFQVRHFPKFVDYCDIYMKELNQQLQKKLLTPDFITQARDALEKLK